MKLAIVLSTQEAKFEAVAFRGNFKRNVSRIASYGYEGVELAVRDPNLVDGKQIKRVVEQYKLVVPAIGTGQAWGEEGLSFTDPDQSVRTRALERAKSHIDLARKTNSIVIIGLLRGVVRAGVSEKRAEEWMINALEECASKALEMGVRVALEPLNRYETSLVNTVEQGLSLVDKIGYENLGLLLDTFHMNIEEPSIEESIRTAGERIFHFHVADSNRWYPGAGHLDFTRILEALYETGYRGFVSGEFMPKPDADTSAQRAIEHLKGLIIHG